MATIKKNTKNDCKDTHVELVDSETGDILIFNNPIDAECYKSMLWVSEHPDPLGMDIDSSWSEIKFKKITKGSVQH